MVDKNALNSDCLKSRKLLSFEEEFMVGSLVRLLMVAVEVGHKSGG